MIARGSGPGLRAAIIRAVSPLVANSLVWIVVILALAATLLSGGIFLRPSNLVTILFQIAVVAVLAVGQTVVILTGGIDLSVGALVVLCAIIISATSAPQSINLPQLGVAGSLFAGLALGAAVGFANGIVVARTRIPPFIVTLAMLLLVGGVSNAVTRGIGVYADPFYQAFGGAKVWIVPLPVVGWIVLIALGHVLLTRTRFAAQLYAIGGNEGAARLAGVPVQRVKVMAYTLCGLLSGLAAVFFLARTGYAIPSAGSDLLFTSISAVVIGGVSLSGGYGRLPNVFLGLLVLAILGNVMNLLLISPFVQSAVQGALIMVAVAANIALAQAGGRSLLKRQSSKPA